MFRIALACAVLLAPSAVSAPVPREEHRPPVPLAGSVWEGNGIVSPTTYEFHPDGQLTMSYNGNRHLYIGTWQQHGRRVFWEANRGYSVFEGQLTGTTITGNLTSRPGGQWELTVKRTSVPRED